MAIVASLQDNFNDNSTDTTKWPNAYSSSSSYSETGGQLVITLANAIAGSNYAGYNTSPNTYDLTGNFAMVQIPTVPSGANCQVLLKLDAGSGNTLYFQINNTTLAAVKVVASSQSNVATTTYNSTNHQWLRIRESGGTTFWDTSADGKVWTNFTSVANPITVTSLMVEISAGTFGSQASPGTCHFDNFNINQSAGQFFPFLR